MLNVVLHRDVSSRQKQKRARDQRLVLQNIGISVPPISKKPTRPASIKIVEKSYLKDVLELINPMYRLVRELLIPEIPLIVNSYKESIKVDVINYADKLTKVFEQLSLEMLLTVPNERVGVVAFKNGEKTNRFNKRQIDKSIKSVLGIDIFRSEPWLASQLASFTERNVALIKSLPQAYFGSLQTKIRTEIEKGTSSRKIAKVISEETGVSRRKARLITRDQVSKFNGKLNELRQTEMGITKYTWSTSGDEKVRKTHRDHNGKVFSWSKPPSNTGHPGTDVQCRCVPIAFLEEFQETPKKKKGRRN